MAQGFSKAISEHEYVIHALAILPDHLHLAMAYHTRNVKDISKHMKARATLFLAKAGLHPLRKFAAKNGRMPSPWARNYWCPFIRSKEHMRSAIKYVENNPAKAGLRRQHWSLVTPYKG